MNKKVLLSALMVVSLFLQPLTAFGAFAKIAPIIQVGQLNVSVSPLTRVASNIQAGTNGAELATFDFTAVRENILIRKIGVQIGGSVDVTKIKNGRLVDNQGRIVFGPIVNGNGLGSFTFVGNATVQRNSILSLKFLADVNQGAANGATVRAYIPAAASFLANGSVSGNRILPTGRFPVTGRTMTIVNVPPVVQAGSLNVTSDLSLPPFSTVIAGTRDVTLMKINFTASNVEDIELRRLRLKVNGVRDNDVMMISLIKDSDGTRIYSAAAVDGAMNADMARFITIQKGTTEVVSVRADLSANSSPAQIQVEVENPADVTGIGSASAAQAQIFGNFPVRGSQISVIDNGTLTVTAGDLAAQTVTAGQDRTLAAFDFTAANEDMMIRELKLNFVGNPALVSWVKIVRQDTNELLYQGSIVGGQFDARFFNANVVVPKGGSLTLIIKGDITDQFINPGDNDRSMSFSIQNADDVVAMGVMSNMVIFAQGNFPITGPVMTLQAANGLKVSLSNEVQLNGFLMPGLNTLAGFKLEAGNEALEIRNLKVKLMSNNLANIRMVNLYIRSGANETLVYSGVPTMLGGQMAEVGGALNSDVDLGEYSSKILVVKAQLNGGNIGDVIQAQIERATDISALSSRSAEFVDVLGVFPLMAGVQRF
ncbi:MAG: hypothetical protein WCT53_00990 [Candidatus Gracilibacteria bacterium]